MRFVTAIVHYVENLATARDFFCHGLGFYASSQRNDYGVLLENGAVSVRLLEGKTTSYPLNLEIYSQQLDEDCTALLAFSNVSLFSKKKQVHLYRLEICLQAPHNLKITLFQELNEDDLGILPTLPLSLDWEQPAIECVQQLLTYIPLDFRQLARQRIIERAEMLAAEQGEISVILENAVQALAETTPYFQHATLVTALQERGINPQNYFHLPLS